MQASWSGNGIFMSMPYACLREASLTMSSRPLSVFDAARHILSRDSQIPAKPDLRSQILEAILPAPRIGDSLERSYCLGPRSGDLLGFPDAARRSLELRPARSGSDSA